MTNLFVSKIWKEQGKEAFNGGKVLSDNPWHKTSYEGREWRQGWYDEEVVYQKIHGPYALPYMKYSK